MGDEDRVRQVLVNLLSNAVKFTPPGGTVTVTTGTVDTAQLPDLPIASEHSTFFRVRDTGIGIAPEQLEDIFQPFMQVEAGHTRTRGGTGLGLTISRHLARLMGGELTAESTPGMGSTFTLWLPTERVSQPLPQSILDAAAAERRAGLAVVGAGLQQSMPRILQRFTERLRRDPSVPQARSLDRSNVENHAASLLADISQGVASLEHGGMDIAEYLRDGTEIQQVISKLHGAQRARLSWTEGAIRREYVVLREEIERAIRETVPDQVAELGEALRIVGRFLQHSERVSIQSWREIMSELEG